MSEETKTINVRFEPVEGSQATLTYLNDALVPSVSSIRVEHRAHKPVRVELEVLGHNLDWTVPAEVAVTVVAYDGDMITAENLPDGQTRYTTSPIVVP